MGGGTISKPDVANYIPYIPPLLVCVVVHQVMIGDFANFKLHIIIIVQPP